MREPIHDSDKYPFEELESLLLESIGGDFEAPSRERLNSLLRESPEARAFASGLLYDDALMADALSADAAEATFRESKTNRASIQKKSRAVWLRFAAVVTIGLIPLLLMWNLPDTSSSSVTAATIQSTNRVSGLNTGQTFQPGDEVELREGRVVLRFASGAKFSIEAPALFTVSGPNSADLDSGRGTIRVPGKIKGFTVTTPTEKVVDLGTAFGIEVAGNGQTSVAVLEGVVELQSTAQPQRLLAGQSTRSVEFASPARSIPHIVDAFLNTWETSFGVESIVGDLRLARPGERLAPGLAVDRDSLLLFPERESVTLPEGYVLNSTRTGLHQRPFRRQQDPLAGSVTVDSYLLQYHPGADSTTPAEDQIFTAELRFDRPVVGLILGADRLAASDAELAMPGAQLGSINRRGVNIDDQVELSEDRRTLHIRMSIRDSVDQIRVLVDAKT